MPDVLFVIGVFLFFAVPFFGFLMEWHKPFLKLAKEHKEKREQEVVKTNITKEELLFEEIRKRDVAGEPTCLYCRNADLQPGPEGGLSLNLVCPNCGAVYNLIRIPGAPRVEKVRDGEVIPGL